MRPERSHPETLIEKQIREATERGAFDNLPGMGKPIEGLDQPFSAERWARQWIEREGGDTSALLSPLLILRRERASFLASLAEIPTEKALRELVKDFNHRLLDQYRRPMNGPLIPVGVIDADETAATWQAQRPPPPPPPAAHQTAPRRRWWRRVRRRAGVTQPRG